jgi:hypothetical protein
MKQIISTISKQLTWRERLAIKFGTASLYDDYSLKMRFHSKWEPDNVTLVACGEWLYLGPLDSRGYSDLRMCRTCGECQVDERTTTFEKLMKQLERTETAYQERKTEETKKERLEHQKQQAQEHLSAESRKRALVWLRDLRGQTTKTASYGKNLPPKGD